MYTNNYDFGMEYTHMLSDLDEMWFSFSCWLSFKANKEGREGFDLSHLTLW